MRKQQPPVRRMCGGLLGENYHSDRMRAGGKWLLFTWRFGSGHECDRLSCSRCAAVSLRTCRLPGARAQQIYVKRCFAEKVRLRVSEYAPRRRCLMIEQKLCIIFNTEPRTSSRADPRHSWRQRWRAGAVAGIPTIALVENSHPRASWRALASQSKSPLLTGTGSLHRSGNKIRTEPAQCSGSCSSTLAAAAENDDGISEATTCLCCT